MPPQQVNLHVFGFEMLAASDLGKVSIRYRLVACQPVDPITIHVDAYRVSGGGWLRLALKSVAGDGQVTSIELVGLGASLFQIWAQGRGCLNRAKRALATLHAA